MPISLIKDLPSAIQAGGRSYGIRTDHRTSLAVSMVIEDALDGEIEHEHVPSIIVGLYRPQLIVRRDRYGIPLFSRDDPVDEIYVECMRFLRCDEENEPDKPGPRTFSWKADQDRLVPDFQREYNVDLTDQKTSMHWWRFCRLLSGLSDSSAIKSIMRLRRDPIPPDLKPDKRIALIEAKRAVALAPRRVEELAYYQDIM